jgi:hypothetical protein
MQAVRALIALAATCIEANRTGKKSEALASDRKVFRSIARTLAEYQVSAPVGWVDRSVIQRRDLLLADVTAEISALLAGFRHGRLDALRFAGEAAKLLAPVVKQLEAPDVSPSAILAIARPSAAPSDDGCPLRAWITENRGPKAAAAALVGVISGRERSERGVRELSGLDQVEGGLGLRGAEVEASARGRRPGAIALVKVALRSCGFHPDSIDAALAVLLSREAALKRSV